MKWIGLLNLILFVFTLIGWGWSDTLAAGGAGLVFLAVAVVAFNQGRDDT